MYRGFAGWAVTLASAGGLAAADQSCTFQDRLLIGVRGANAQVSWSPTSKRPQEIRSREEKVDPTALSQVQASPRKTDFKAALPTDSPSSYTRGATAGPELARLEIGGVAIFMVHARTRRNQTKVLVLPGDKYKVELAKPGRWVDWFIPCGPRGYHFFITDRSASRLRTPNAPFFALMVTVDDDDLGACTVVTRDQPLLEAFQPSRRGELVFFANDLDRWYWNNWGSLSVRVTRTQ